MTANIGNVSVNANSAYEQSFGTLGDKTCYSGERMGVSDLRAEAGTLG